MTARGSAPLLSRRVLNRTLLARQLLLERVDRPVVEVIEHLVGMQAQEPPDPYVGLWSRIAGFDPQDLSRLIEERGAVRMGLLRGTLHLVTARDATAHYPILADVMARSWRSSPFVKRLVGVDLDAVIARAREALEERPRTPSELGAALAPGWPDRRCHVAGVRRPVPAAARPGAAPRAVAEDGPTDKHDGGGVAGPWDGPDPERRRPHPALPGGLRAGDGERYAGLVVADRPARGRGAPAPEAAYVPGRGRPRAVRRAGRPDRGCGPACPDPVPALL